MNMSHVAAARLSRPIALCQYGLLALVAWVESSIRSICE
jgi:hypothetical protein